MARKASRKLKAKAAVPLGVTWNTWSSAMQKTLNTVAAQTAQILAILQQEEKQMATTQTMTDLENAISQNNTVMGSAVTLIEGLIQQLKDAAASGDDAAVEAKAAEILANTQALSAAIAANTPAQPAAAPAAE